MGMEQLIRSQTPLCTTPNCLSLGPVPSCFVAWLYVTPEKKKKPKQAISYQVPEVLSGAQV